MIFVFRLIELWLKLAYYNKRKHHANEKLINY